MAQKLSRPKLEPESGDTQIHYTIKDWRITFHKGEFPK